MSIKVEHIDNFLELGKAVKLSNNKYELIITLDVGPRIIHFSLLNGENVFEQDVALSEELPDGTVMRLYGGHRVWHAPEAYPRSYISDSHPVEKYELTESGIIVTAKKEKWTNMQKQTSVKLLDTHVEVTSMIKNAGAWPIEYAVWSLMVGSRGGRLICPITQRNTGLLPNTVLCSWPYSKMNDERVYWGGRYIVVDNNDTTPGVFKFGYGNELGWTAYFNKGVCFVNQYDHQIGAKYPDMGCSFETYTADWGIEIETLSPLKTVQPDETYELVNRWYIIGDVDRPSWDEDEIDEIMGRISEEVPITIPYEAHNVWSPT